MQSSGLGKLKACIDMVYNLSNSLLEIVQLEAFHALPYGAHKVSTPCMVCVVSLSCAHDFIFISSRAWKSPVR